MPVLYKFALAFVSRSEVIYVVTGTKKHLIFGVLLALICSAVYYCLILVVCEGVPGLIIQAIQKRLLRSSEFDDFVMQLVYLFSAQSSYFIITLGLSNYMPSVIKGKNALSIWFFSWIPASLYYAILKFL